MPLQSKLFRNDPQLEAAALRDAAHVCQGARGDHVRKLQLALVLTDQSRIDIDGRYGPKTAGAVKAFKTKRRIVNARYQSQPDDIVGRMTMAALDKEVTVAEKPKGPMTVHVISPRPAVHHHRPHVAMSFNMSGFMPASTRFSIGRGMPGVSMPLVKLDVGGTATVQVKNGAGAIILTSDADVARANGPGGMIQTTIASDDETITIVGIRTGSVVIAIVPRGGLSWDTAATLTSTNIAVSVKNNSGTVYTPTIVPHNHQPVADWRALLAKIHQPTRDLVGITLNGLRIARAEPEMFVSTALTAVFANKPVARRHLEWYLRDGNGMDFVEDKILEQWLKSDHKLRAALRDTIQKDANGRTQFRTMTPLQAQHYADMDMYYCFGTLDRVDLDVDFVAGTVKVWFKDIYEWHPYCPPEYDDILEEARNTNTLHAAMVQMKTKGARDFWMLGEATVKIADL